MDIAHIITIGYDITWTWYICCYGLDKNKIAATNFKLQNKLRRIQTDYLIVLKAKKKIRS